MYNFLPLFLHQYQLTLPCRKFCQQDLKKEFQQKESSLNSEINNLKASIVALKAKMKDKMNNFSQAIKKVNNDIVVEMNNLQ